MNRIGEMGEIFRKAKSDYVPRRTILHLCCSSACPQSWGSSAPTQDQAQTLADMFVPLACTEYQVYQYQVATSGQENSHLVQGVPSFPRQLVRPFSSLEIITIFYQNISSLYRNIVYNGVSPINMQRRSSVIRRKSQRLLFLSL